MATRLQELDLLNSRLQGSADDFLTKGWTALTSLSLTGSQVEHATLAAALHLPALKDLSIDRFSHQGRALQLDQLAGGYLQVSRVKFELGSGVVASEGGEWRCSLLHLCRLKCLHIIKPSRQDSLGLDLPASLVCLRVESPNLVGKSPRSFGWYVSMKATRTCLLTKVHVGLRRPQEGGPEWCQESGSCEGCTVACTGWSWLTMEPE